MKIPLKKLNTCQALQLLHTMTLEIKETSKIAKVIEKGSLVNTTKTKSSTWLVPTQATIPVIVQTRVIQIKWIIRATDQIILF